MKYSSAFSQLVDHCLQNDSYIGIGNPDAKILLVGKEAAMAPHEIEDSGYRSNARKWKEIVDGEATNHLIIKDVKKGHYLQKAGVTWRKYQLLHDAIFQKDPQRNGEGLTIDFMRHIFTTEMNDAPHKTTGEAQAAENFAANLKARREDFFSQPFIQQFPVIILACSNYIKNHGEYSEINDTFGVTFTEQVDIADTAYRFWTHHSTDAAQSKLVIHCRQLSGAIPQAFFDTMGTVIRQHLG